MQQVIIKIIIDFCGFFHRVDCSLIYKLITQINLRNKYGRVYQVNEKKWKA